MPKSVRWLAEAWEQLQSLPEELYKEALRTAGLLMADPYPQDSEPDREIPDTFILRSGFITMFYRVIGDDVDVVRVRPNS